MLIITKHKTKIIWDKSLNLAEVTILRSDKKPIIKNRNKKSFNWKKEFSKKILFFQNNCLIGRGFLKFVTSQRI